MVKRTYGKLQIVYNNNMQAGGSLLSFIILCLRIHIQYEDKWQLQDTGQHHPSVSNVDISLDSQYFKKDKHQKLRLTDP